MVVWAMAQASKAILPKDVNGPWGQRIGVSVGGNLNWALRVGAYVTARNNASDWLRYSLVVLNWYDRHGFLRCTEADLATFACRDDSADSGWNPQPVSATIEFRGMQATYTFPVGVMTLWWYAPKTSNGKLMNATAPAEQQQQPTPVRVNGTASATGAAPQYSASVVWSTPAKTEPSATEEPAFKIRGARWW